MAGREFLQIISITFSMYCIMQIIPFLYVIKPALVYQ